MVNVSSPNTPGLRELQDKEPLTKLLTTLQEINQSKDHPKPLLLKIAPDLTEGQLDDIIGIAQETKLSGLIATNTTISREDLAEPIAVVEEIGAGGVSGAPVRTRASDVISTIHDKSEGQVKVIGVGGIFTAEHAREKLNAGAAMVQVYTGFIYEGPACVKRILKGL